MQLNSIRDFSVSLKYRELNAFYVQSVKACLSVFAMEAWMTFSVCFFSNVSVVFVP